MDLRPLRTGAAALALAYAGTANAALPTYVPSSVTLPTLATDTSFFLNGNPFFDNNHLLAMRSYLDGNGATHPVYEIYSMADLSTPVKTFDAVTNPPAYTNSGALVGEYFYVERYDSNGVQRTQRCRYTDPNGCHYDVDGDWQTVADVSDTSYFPYAMLNSTLDLSNYAVLSVHDAGGMHLRLVTPSGLSYPFAGFPDNAYAVTAGYVNGFITTLVKTSGGTMAYVFSTADIANGSVHAFLLDSDPLTEPIDLNASGRAAFLTRPSTSSASGDVSICALSVSSSAGEPSGVSCTRQVISNQQMAISGMFTARLKDDNELVFWTTTDVLVLDTDNPGAGAVPIASLTGGAVTGQLLGVTGTDGRVLAATYADAASGHLYTYTLLTPGNFGGGGGGGATNTLTVAPQPTVVNPGDSRNVLVSLNIDATDFYGLQFSCHADPSILAFVSGEYVSLADSLTIPFAYDSGTGIVDGAFSLRAPMQPYTGTGTLSVLTYVASAAYGTTDVTCDVLGSDIDGNPVSFTVVNSSVTINDGVHVTGGATISGVAQLPVGTDWSGTTVTLTINGTSVSTTTDATGHYSFSDVQNGAIALSFDAPTYVAQCLSTTVAGGNNATLPTSKLAAGDINDDNVIDIADFTMMAGRFGSQSGDGRYLAVADLNADGKINIQDLAILGSHFGMTACTGV